MTFFRETYKKHHQNLCFFIRGLAFITKKSESLIIKEFGLRSYAILSFTGQQYKTTEEYNSRYWDNDKYCQAAKKKYTALVKEACKIASDEVAAEFQYEMCNFKTVANKYPKTSKGKLVKGKCDNLIDYSALNK